MHFATTVPLNACYRVKCEDCEKITWKVSCILYEMRLLGYLRIDRDVVNTLTR